MVHSTNPATVSNRPYKSHRWVTESQELEPSSTAFQMQEQDARSGAKLRPESRHSDLGCSTCFSAALALATDNSIKRKK